MSDDALQAHVANGNRRRSRPPRSHEDIYDAVEEAKAGSADAVHRTDLLMQVIQRVETKFDELTKVVGSAREDEHGVQVGTGIAGDVMRLNKHVGDRFRLYDRWMAMAIGGMGVGLPLLGFIWWLVSAKLEHVLK